MHATCNQWTHRMHTKIKYLIRCVRNKKHGRCYVPEFSKNLKMQTIRVAFVNDTKITIIWVNKFIIQ